MDRRAVPINFGQFGRVGSAEIRGGHGGSRDGDFADLAYRHFLHLRPIGQRFVNYFNDANVVRCDDATYTHP